ncbi:LysR family transcriptional regulator [Paucibacter sp. XJ19-41]|uniref:LysR family transcriptional regulator n=1 Tax=Paucibacter sp. XJ19-41 TaxID=2927824 RepID=UPI00234B0C8A|nr:LysR family transcriptional regulator [Paucibacter sp. XJ19-41]MDC6168701.1 LysR family transcriptional regulator [Paucibacter sp. XJ19-41]
MSASLQSLRAFRAVAELGGFARAAVQLGVTGSAVTKLVAALEASLGVQLLLRSTRQVALTAAGEAFLPDCAELLDAADAALARVSALGNSPSGRLRIALPTSFALRFVAARLPEFLLRHPQLRLDLSLSDRYVDLLAERFDGALRIGSSRLADSSLRARALGRVERVLVAAPRYLRQAAVLERPTDLVAHNALVYALADGGSGSWPFVVAGRPVQVAVGGQLRVDNSLLLREALTAGLGVALTPRFVVDDLLASGALLSLLEPFLPAPLTVHALSTQRHGLASRAKPFFDFIEAQLRQAGYGTD